MALIQSAGEVIRGGADLKGMFVQVGAFKERHNAIKLARKLNLLSRSSFRSVNVSDASLYRVRIGPVKTLEEAHKLLRRRWNSGVAQLPL